MMAPTQKLFLMNIMFFWRMSLQVINAYDFIITLFCVDYHNFQVKFDENWTYKLLWFVDSKLV